MRRLILGLAYAWMFVAVLQVLGNLGRAGELLFGDPYLQGGEWPLDDAALKLVLAGVWFAVFLITFRAMRVMKERDG